MVIVGKDLIFARRTRDKVCACWMTVMKYGLETGTIAPLLRIGTILHRREREDACGWFIIVIILLRWITKKKTPALKYSRKLFCNSSQILSQGHRWTVAGKREAIYVFNLQESGTIWHNFFYSNDFFSFFPWKSNTVESKYINLFQIKKYFAFFL